MKIFKVQHGWPHKGVQTFIFANREKAIEFAKGFRWESPVGENESIEIYELEVCARNHMFLETSGIPIYCREDKRKFVCETHNIFLEQDSFCEYCYDEMNDDVERARKDHE